MISLRCVAVDKINGHKYSVTYTPNKGHRSTFKLTIDLHNTRNIELQSSIHCRGMKAIREYKERIDYALDIAELIKDSPQTIIGVYRVYEEKYTGIQEKIN